MCKEQLHETGAAVRVYLVPQGKGSSHPFLGEGRPLSWSLQALPASEAPAAGTYLEEELAESHRGHGA